MSNPFRIGDPVMDAAQGRPMIVLDAPDETVAEWSDREGYDLQSNYANGKFDPDADEHVVECVYVSDVRSEPSKTYTFPVSRVVLIDAHHADDGQRVYDRVLVDVLRSLMLAAEQDNGPHSKGDIAQLATYYFGQDMIQLASELADVDRTVTAE